MLPVTTVYVISVPYHLSDSTSAVICQQEFNDTVEERKGGPSASIDVPAVSHATRRPDPYTGSMWAHCGHYSKTEDNDSDSSYRT